MERAKSGDQGHSVGDALIVFFGLVFGSPMGLTALLTTIMMGIMAIGFVATVMQDIPNPIAIEQLSATTVRGSDAKCYRIVQQGGKPSFVLSDCPKK